MLTEYFGSLSKTVYHYYSSLNQKYLIVLTASILLILMVFLFPFKINFQSQPLSINPNIHKIRSPFSRTLAFIRMNMQRLERIQVLENYRPFFIDLHYSIPHYTNITNYTIDGWISGGEPYKVVADTMQILLNNYSMVEGVLYFHFDAWINPFQFDRMNFDSIWLAGQLSTYICGGNTVGSKWIYWTNDSLRSVQNAKRTISKEYPNRFITDENIMCGGWADIYYIPRRFFSDFIVLSNVFKKSGSFHEIGIPTMFNMIDLTHRPTPFHTVITHLEDCWGGCCAYGAGITEIKKKRCGHKMDLANGQITNTLIEFLKSESSYLNHITPNKSNNQSIWINYMWDMFKPK
ncbi:hypothetical protein I4U23_003541 [Adineta vaga]|nr:hypothetical protein I4U23_003541 [Adineta vaga]